MRLLCLNLCLFVLVLLGCGGQIESGKWHSDSQLIQGGETVPIEQFPWQVAIYSENRFTEQLKLKCGGSIIDQQWVLTSVSCANKAVWFSRLWVLAGSNQADAQGKNSDPQSQWREVSESYNHPKFSVINNLTNALLPLKRSPIQNLNDLALLRLAQPLDFETDNVNKIVLATKEDQSSELFEEGTFAWISGYGLVKEIAEEDPDTLLAASLPIISNQQAEEHFETHHKELEESEHGACTDFPRRMSPGQIATGATQIQIKEQLFPSPLYPDLTFSPFYGDALGPLVVLDLERNQFILVGIVSYALMERSNGISYAKAPQVYTRVSFYESCLSNPENFPESFLDCEIE